MKPRLRRSLASALASCLVLLVLQGSQALAQASQSCPQYSPVVVVTGAKMYKEGGGVDVAGARANRELLGPVDDFLTYQAKALDQATRKNELECQYQALREWASANALLGPPETPGRVARVWIASGVGFIVLKYKLRGVEITAEVRHWLSALAEAVRDDYRNPLKKGAYIGLYSNVYPWSAVTNAIAALVNGDAQALRFQDDAWANMLAQIRPDGTLQGEMGREQRALIYHQLAANGLIVLHDLRRALGRKDEPAQLANFKRLLVFVGEALCHPEKVEAAAGAKQETPGVWGFRIPFAFGGELLPASWKTCGPDHMNWFAPEYAGGDTRVAAEALAAITRQ